VVVAVVGAGVVVDVVDGTVAAAATAVVVDARSQGFGGEGIVD